MEGEDGQQVAVKTYDHRVVRGQASVFNHMQNEERLAGKISHENIIAPRAVNRLRGRTELEMEYAPGGNLEAYIKKLGKHGCNEDEARRIFRQVVDAVAYLHKKDICHRGGVVVRVARARHSFVV